MTITNKVTLKSLNAGLTPATDVPDAPTIGTATAGLLSASVTFTAAATGGTPTSYTATSSPGGFTATGASSPLTVSGLTAGTSYTFTVTATNSAGTSPASSASNSATPASPLGYESIATATVDASGSLYVDFTSIPQTYTHLQLRGFTRMNSASTEDNVYFRMNGVTTQSYSFHYVSADGASTYAGAPANPYYYSFAASVPGNNASSSIFGTFVLDILDYTSTNKNKVLRSLAGNDRNGSGIAQLLSGMLMSTSAVTSVRIMPNDLSAGTKFVQYSHFALYGVK